LWKKARDVGFGESGVAGRVERGRSKKSHQKSIKKKSRRGFGPKCGEVMEEKKVKSPKTRKDRKKRRT